MKLYKEGNCWKACYDQQRKKYYGYIMYTDEKDKPASFMRLPRKSSIGWGHSLTTMTTTN